MKSPQLSLLFIIILVSLYTFTISTGCAKEYSYEGGDTIRIPVDTLPSGGPVGDFPVCNLCSPVTDVALGTWDFMEGNSYLCGNTTNSGFIGGNSRTSFTFFGPSACSIDTGLVVSAFLNVPLDQNRFNVSTDQTEFYYYDHKSAYDIFDNDPVRGKFTVVLQSYILSTGVATGTFSGTVFKKNNDSVHITSGRFKVLVKM